MKNRIEKKEHKEKVILSALAMAIILTAVLSLTMGSYGIPLGQIWDIITHRLSGQEVGPANQQADAVLFMIRLPRILLSIMAGAALAASGAAYQGMFRNPMVSPDILGISRGAGVGATLGLLLSFPSWAVQLNSFAFGIGAMLLMLTLTRAAGRGRNSLLVMVLSGIVISSIFMSFTSLIKLLADSENKLPAITFWLMGSFARSNSSRGIMTMLIALLFGGVPLLFLRWKMNVLSFGDEEAQTMGINVKQTRFIIIVCSTLLTASSVSLCGTIEWVGLIIPHICRYMVGPNYRALMPTAMLTGGLFMLAVDYVARVIVPGEIPIGILTSMIGAPLFVYMLLRERREWT